MSKRLLILACALCAVGSLTTVRSQQPQPSPQSSRAPAKKASSNKTAGEVDPMEEVRRTTAITLVSSLANDAQMFRDPVLRARVQARAADALWDSERERALTLFRRAWDEAEAADAESDRKLAEQRAQHMRERGTNAVLNTSPSVRAEVLRLAAKRDRALGEEFLKRLDEARKQEADNAATSNERPADDAAQQQPQQRRDPLDTPPAVAKRLRLAIQLLQDGDAERALQFADPALGAVTTPALEFLTRLRASNKQAADERYAAMLSRAALDPSTDANTVSLLSSYLFTPTLYMTFTADGGSSANSWGRDFPPPADTPPPLRAAYFNLAASVLLRPTPPPQQDYTSAGRTGWYMVIARLMPLFDRFAPDKSAALHAKMASLAPDAPDGVTQPGVNDALTRGLVPEDPSRDRVQEALNQLDSAKNSDDRDSIYVNAIMSALRNGDPRAEELVNKIEDTDLRQRVRAYVDFQSVHTALGKNDTNEVVKIARAGGLTAIQKTWALTEAARLLSKSDPGRAADLLDEALREAKEHIDDAAPERVSALVSIATQFAELNDQRAWTVMQDAVKAANASKTYTGEDGRLGTRLETKNMTMMSNFSAESFDLSGIFARLARENLPRAIDLAHGFDGEAPRAVATLAIAHAILDKSDKKPPARAAAN
jgi:tetratricopeptide (TPR) repeat protein